VDVNRPNPKEHTMNRTFSLAALVAVFLLGVSVAAAGIAETIKLTPRGGSAVSGTATVASPGDTAAARVSVRLKGLKPGALVRVQLNVVEEKNTSASTALILVARANTGGAVVASGRVLYRGQPVTFASIADGAHAVSVVTAGRVVARGVIPGMD
jgi:hypothetical protein